MKNCRRHPRPESQAGFTIIEMIVALAVLGILLGAILEAYSSGLRTLSTSDRYQRAVLIAQSKMDLLTFQEIEARRESGEEGEFDWAIEMREADAEDLPEADSVGWRLFQVTVIVSWPPDREVRLDTLRLGPP